MIRALAFVGLLVLMLDVAQMRIGGLALVGALMIFAALALSGFFSRDFWFVPREREAACIAVDHDLDVQAELDAMFRRSGDLR